MLEQGNVRGFVVMEQLRLREKLSNMKRAGIETVPDYLARFDLTDREYAAWNSTPQTRAAYGQIFTD